MTDIQPSPTFFTKRVVSLVMSSLPMVCSVIGCAGVQRLREELQVVVVRLGAEAVLGERGAERLLDAREVEVVRARRRAARR